MKKVRSFTRGAAVCMLFFTGINAVIAGWLLMRDPSGGTMGLSLDYIRYSPFASYRIPGFILFVVLGLFSLTAATITLTRSRLSPLLIIFQGLVLCGWILVQITMVRDINFLHIIMFITGILLLDSGLRLGKLQHQR